MRWGGAFNFGPARSRLVVSAYTAPRRELRLLRRSGAGHRAAPRAKTALGVEQWLNLRPDVLTEFRTGSQPFRFWLEWDRGTMNPRDLAVKFDAYRQFVASREWARERSQLPRLLCVAPDIAQERRMQRVAQIRLSQPPGPAVWTTTEVLLQANGPLAPIWMQVTFQWNQPDKAGVVRRCNAFGEDGRGKGWEEAVYQLG